MSETNHIFHDIIFTVSKVFSIYLQNAQTTRNKWNNIFTLMLDIAKQRGVASVPLFMDGDLFFILKINSVLREKELLFVNAECKYYILKEYSEHSH